MQPPLDMPLRSRRHAIAQAAGLLLALLARPLRAAGPSEHPELRWYQAAAEMKRRAESWGDQPYGAVLVLDGAIVGEGPSRVVKNNDASAHAEREAIRDAQRRLGAASLRGATLYSTSRPCSLCEAAAAKAKVGRMVFGPALTDAGVPRAGTE